MHVLCCKVHRSRRGPKHPNGMINPFEVIFDDPGVAAHLKFTIDWGVVKMLDNDITDEEFYSARFPPRKS